MMCGVVLAATTGCGMLPGSAASTETSAWQAAQASGAHSSGTLPRAADRQDYDSCRDGTCEILVTGPTTIDVGHGTLTVVDIDPDGVTFDLDLATGGGGSGTFHNKCGTIARFYLDGRSEFTGCPDGEMLPPPDAQPASVALQLKGRTDKTAVLRVVSG